MKIKKYMEWLQKNLIQPILRSVMKRPIFWCVCASVLLCLIVTGIAFRSHERSVGENPLTSLSEDRSHVLNNEVADLYAQAAQPETPQETPPPVVAVTDPVKGAQTDTLTSSAALQASARPTEKRQTTVQLILPTLSPLPLPDDNGLMQPQEPIQQPDTQPTPPEEALPSAPPETIIPPETVSRVTLATNLTEEAVHEPMFLLKLTASEPDNVFLLPSAINVLCNEKTVYAGEFDGTIVSYLLNLQIGVNNLLITVTDSLGTTSQYETTLVYQLPQPETAPQLQVSIEATTVGLGYLVPPISVPYEEGKPVSHYIDKILTVFGYTTRHTGSITSGYYLAGIEKKEAFATPVIPEDLKLRLLAEPAYSEQLDETNFSPDFLGERQFTPFSGWQYSVNSVYANKGMSQVIPNPGDCIRLRYTLALGKDIGNFFSPEEEAIPWEREW